jgi:hypothetical protein
MFFFGLVWSSLTSLINFGPSGSSSLVDLFCLDIMTTQYACCLKED